MASLNYPKIEYLVITGKKQCMAQMFDENAKLVPYTIVSLDKNEINKNSIISIQKDSSLKITGYTKGRGFTGAMKRWDFAGGPATHGQKSHHRSVGSIGSQGQGRVVPGRKMPGRYGNERITMQTSFLGYDATTNSIKLKGSIPGARNSKIYLYVQKHNEN